MYRPYLAEISIAIDNRTFSRSNRNMQLHAIKKQHEELLNLPVVGIGSFATVFSFDATSVLKVTSCGVTQKLFDTALTKPLSWPPGLPEVLKGYGPMATDGEGTTYKGYLVERLFTAAEWETESRGARAVINGKAIKKSGKRKVTTVVAEVQALEDVKALAEMHQPDPDLSHADAQLAFALDMASRVDEPLRSGFLYLADFVAKGGAAFDLTTPDNLRLDCFGRVKLCDPASYAGDQSDPPKPTAYVLCDVPLSVNGFTLTLKSMAVRAKDSTHALSIAERLLKLGLFPSISRKLGEVKAYLQKPDYCAPVFGFVGAARNVVSGAYASAMRAQTS